MYFFVLFTVLISCTSDGQKGTVPDQPIHKKHNRLVDNFAHKDIIILDTIYKVNDTVSERFREVVNLYLQISKALVDGNTDAVDKSVMLMIEKINAIPFEAFEGEGLLAWQQHAGLYQEKLKEMQHIEGLENKRSYFGHISEIMYCTVKSFDFQLEPLFMDFCPMAFDGKGAYWLSNSKTIQNPYFGSAMLNCGEIKEEL